MFNFKIHAKKGQKMHFNLKIHAKKRQKWKKLFGFFRFYIPCAFFCILNLKIHAKKTKMQKKAKQIFQIRKIYMQKKGRK